MSIGALVLEAGLDKFFDCPAVRKTFEVIMAFLSLGDPSKNEKDKQIGMYHCNDFGNDWLWLAVPRNGEVKPSLRSYNTTNPQQGYPYRKSTYTKSSVLVGIILKAHRDL